MTDFDPTPTIEQLERHATAFEAAAAACPDDALGRAHAAIHAATAAESRAEIARRQAEAAPAATEEPRYIYLMTDRSNTPAACARRASRRRIQRAMARMIPANADTMKGAAAAAVWQAGEARAKAADARATNRHEEAARLIEAARQHLCMAWTYRLDAGRPY